MFNPKFNRLQPVTFSGENLSTRINGTVADIRIRNGRVEYKMIGLNYWVTETHVSERNEDVSRDERNEAMDNAPLIKGTSSERVFRVRGIQI